MNGAKVLFPIAAALIFCASAFAQTAKEGERAVRPESASNAPIGGWCDALTGEKKADCLRDERRRKEQAREDGPRTGGSCDALFGLEKEACLRRGGSLEVGAASSGARMAREH